MHLRLVATKRRTTPPEFAEFSQRLNLAYTRFKRISGKGHNQIALACDVDAGSLTKWLKGEAISQISIVSGIRLAKGLRVDYAWLTSGNGPIAFDDPAKPLTMDAVAGPEDK